MNDQTTLYDLWQEARKKYSSLAFLGFIGEKPLTFQDAHSRILSYQYWLQNLGLVKGDRIAIYSPNQPAWGLAYLSIVTAGYVAVPILADFHPREVQTIVEAGDVKLALVGKALETALQGWYKENPGTKAVRFEQLENVDAGLADRIPREEEVFLSPPGPQDLAALIYTSGTTGSSKGVMLSHQNLVANVDSSSRIPPIDAGNVFLSVLPLAHTYECTLGLLLPMYCGCCVHYLSKPASPTVLMAALEEVKPHLMLTVPLLIEKIYKAKIKPQLSHGLVGILTKVPLLKNVIIQAAGKKLMVSFGGRLRFFGIGGAPLDPEVEKFLRIGKFPYAIGYGLTETAPLLAGAPPYGAPFRSTGPAIHGVELRLADKNPETGVGEIQARGANIMQGYYNNPQATQEAFTEDGWFRTGDLGSFDAQGMLTIRGRSKSVILSSSGENIYPEAIEALINQQPLVAESLVVARGKDLVAKVVLNYEAMMKNMSDKAGDLQQEAKKYLKHLHEEVNRHLNSFSKIKNIEEHPEPFEKTPTLKIKRFLYHDDQKKTK